MKYLTKHVRRPLCAACEANQEAWKDLGMNLMPDSEATLSKIVVNACGKVIRCCSSLFKLWLQQQPEASWGQLIDALHNAGLDNLAAEIGNKLKPSLEPSLPSASGHTTKATASHVPEGMTLR